MPQKATLLTALPAPQGPQFLELQKVLAHIDGTPDKQKTVFLNVNDIASWQASVTEGRILIQTRYELLTVQSTVKSLKEALNFLRQNPHRASVILRETWDGKAREPSLDDLDEIIPDEKATKV